MQCKYVSKLTMHSSKLMGWGWHTIKCTSKLREEKVGNNVHLQTEVVSVEYNVHFETE